MGHEAGNFAGERRSGWEVSALRLRPEWVMQGSWPWEGDSNVRMGSSDDNCDLHHSLFWFFPSTGPGVINYKIKGGKGLLGREICTLSPKERKKAGKGHPLSTE